MDKKFRNYARALLVAKGLDPNPSNVSKLVAQEYNNSVKIGIATSGYTEYLVYDQDSIQVWLQENILQYPFALNETQLAVLCQKAFSADLELGFISRTMKSFRINPTDSALYTIRRMLELNNNLTQDILAILEQEFISLEQGIACISSTLGVKFITCCYQNKQYFIFEVPKPQEVQK